MDLVLGFSDRNAFAGLFNDEAGDTLDTLLAVHGSKDSEHIRQAAAGDEAFASILGYHSGTREEHGFAGGDGESEEAQHSYGADDGGRIVSG